MKVCAIGPGYVGLVTAACFAEMGNTVWCVGRRKELVDNLKDGKIHIFEPGLDDLVKKNVKEGRLQFTTDLESAVDQALFVFICVGTPPKPDGSSDLSAVREVAKRIGALITEYKIVVDKSTVPVGTADMVRDIIRASLQERGVDVPFDVVSNPEFLKEGDAVNDFMKPDRVIVGADSPKPAEMMKSLYAPFARSREKLMVMGVRSAELTKYAANCMLATKISFINEVANICEKVGADINEVRLGIGSDHRIGYHFIYPGTGFGGSCFPKDLTALLHTARQNGYEPELLESVRSVNERQKLVLADKIGAYFMPKGGVRGRTLALWGVAFKPNTDDVREAPALVLIRALTTQGMRVRVYDPVATENAVKALGENALVEFVDDQYEALEGADALALMTEWNQFRNPDFKAMQQAMNSPVLFDGRNLYEAEELRGSGFKYFGIGTP